MTYLIVGFVCLAIGLVIGFAGKVSIDRLFDDVIKR